jgi:hypothetical protein
VSEQPPQRGPEEGDPRPWERLGNFRLDYEPSGGRLSVGLALASIVCAVLGLLCPLLPLFGLLIAIEARAEAQRDRDRLLAGVLDPNGRETAERGIDFAELAVRVNVLALIYWLLFTGFCLWLFLPRGK